VLWIARRKSRTDRHGGCCDQAVSLTERDPLSGEVPTPAPRAFALNSTEGCQMQPSQETEDQSLFLDVGAAQHLVHVDRAYPRDLAEVQGFLYPLGSRALTQCVD
jgi:hypothetical protein